MSIINYFHPQYYLKYVFAANKAKKNFYTCATFTDFVKFMKLDKIKSSCLKDFYKNQIH